MRSTLVVATLSLLACTASWNSQVRYSETPAPVGQSAPEAIYAAIIQSYLDPRRDTVAILDPAFIERQPFAGRDIAAIPPEWADTLKREVTAALQDTGRASRPQTTPLLNAAMRLGIRLVPPGALGQVFDRSTRPIPTLGMSSPGYNADTTIAVVEVAFHCGPLCGSGQTLFLARRPGHAWRIWHHDLSWVS